MAQPRSAVQTKRIVGFDVVRAAAAMGVIWVHSGRSPMWQENNLSAAGSWGTAFLNTLAGYFVVYTLRDCTGPGVRRFALHRVVRLYGAFLVWSLIYLGARAVNYLIFQKQTSMEWSWDVHSLITYAFFGTTYHLWFLSYLLIITLITLPFVAMAARSRERAFVGAVAFGLVGMLFLIAPEPLWVSGHEPIAVALGQIYLRAPGYLMGVAIGLWVRAGFRSQITAMHALACIGIVVMAMYLSLTTELPRHLLNRIAAIAALLVALAPWRGWLVQRIGKLGELGFGVYLCHVLFVEGLLTIAARLHVPSTLLPDVAVFGAAVVCSFGFAFLLRKVRWLAWTIP
jgi:peptidoglycan/LPS O-acetylase OafA/YrhL